VTRKMAGVAPYSVRSSMNDEQVFQTPDGAVLTAKRWAKEDNAKLGSVMHVSVEILRAGEHWATVDGSGDVVFCEPKKGPRS
jgi:hypothetical protein